MFDMALYSMENLNKLKKSIAEDMPELIERIEKNKADKLEMVRKANRKSGATWRKKNPEQVALNAFLRRKRKASLPYTLTGKDLKIILKIQDGKCILLCSLEGLHLEHFIPISWGIGGTTFENCYYMNGVLNSSKGNRNPFQWITAQPIHIQDNFHNKLVPMMAERNSMTVEEFTTYVNEAYEYYRQRVGE